MAKKKKCGGYCTECKLFDKENQFPGLRRIFIGCSYSGDIVPLELVESRVKKELEDYRKMYERTGDGDLVKIMATERLAWCPVKEAFVWVPDKFLGNWKVFGGKLVQV